MSVADREQRVLDIAAAETALRRWQPGGPTLEECIADLVAETRREAISAGLRLAAESLTRRARKFTHGPQGQGVASQVFNAAIATELAELATGFQGRSGVGRMSMTNQHGIDSAIAAKEPPAP